MPAPSNPGVKQIPAEPKPLPLLDSSRGAMPRPLQPPRELSKRFLLGLLRALSIWHT
jgi:hypothetical protein